MQEHFRTKRMTDIWPQIWNNVFLLLSGSLLGWEVNRVLFSQSDDTPEPWSSRPERGWETLIGIWFGSLFVVFEIAWIAVLGRACVLTVVGIEAYFT